MADDMSFNKFDGEYLNNKDKKSGTAGSQSAKSEHNAAKGGEFAPEERDEEKDADDTI